MGRRIARGGRGCGLSHLPSKLGSMNRARPPIRVRWSAAMLGAVSGLFATLVFSLTAYILLALIYRIGWDDGNRFGWTGLAVSLFAGQFLAGYVAGRLTRTPYAGINGGLAGAGCYAVFALLSRLGGSPAGVSTLVVFGAAAVLLGYGGGKLAGRRYRSPPAEGGDAALDLEKPEEWEMRRLTTGDIEDG